MRRPAVQPFVARPCIARHNPQGYRNAAGELPPQCNAQCQPARTDLQMRRARWQTEIGCTTPQLRFANCEPRGCNSRVTRVCMHHIPDFSIGCCHASNVMVIVTHIPGGCTHAQALGFFDLDRSRGSETPTIGEGARSDGKKRRM